MCLSWKTSFSPELVSQFQSNLVQNHLCIKGIEVCTNKGQGPLQRGDKCKNTVVRFKISFLKNHKARKAQIYMKASW
jgi:hypothetical protein